MREQRGAGVTVARVLVAGVGNVLRGDDGFGIEVVRRLREHADLPGDVTVTEPGIGGVALVQDLLDGYEMVVLVDAVAKGCAPGPLLVFEPEVPEITGRPWDEVSELLGDPHTTTPSRVLLLAQALGALPRRVVIVGCEPLTQEDDLGVGLSPAVAGAVPRAVDTIITLVREAAIHSHGDEG